MRRTAMKITPALKVGHSTWQVGYKTARALNVKTLALSGFNWCCGRDLDAIKAHERLEGETIVATESQTYSL